MQAEQDPRPEPFFVRFLEAEEALAVQTDVKAGRWPAVTLKYPSDGDDDPIEVIA